MPALLPRLSAASVGAAVALAVLGAPTAALAAGPSDPGAAGAARAAQQGPAALPSQAADAAQGAETPARAQAGGGQVPTGSAGGAAAGRSTAQVAATRSARAATTGTERAAAASAGRSATGSGKAARSGGKPAKAAKPATPAKAAKPAKPAKAAKPAKPARPATDAGGKSAESARNGDPRGNNGTFKVDGPVLDTSHGNEPQVDCAFRLNFFGYDQGQLANIVFTPVAPTPGAATTVSGRQLISTDAAKGGLYNGSYPVTGTWTAADLGLDPTVRQHVKVSVESLNADGSDVPGGAKHKVFWLHPCAAAAPVAVTTAGVPEAPAVAPRSISAVPAAQPAVAPAAVPVMGPQAQVMGAAVTAAPAQAATVVTAQAATAPTVVVPVQGAATVAAPRPSQPAMLPFTGSPQLVALLMGGLIALLGGAGLVAAARTSA